MSNLSNYIQKTKKYVEENNFSQLEKVRYVYLNLGKRLSFNLDYSFGNTKTKRAIYNRGKYDEVLEEDFTNKTAICKSISYILEKILKELDVDINTVVEPLNKKQCPHMYNIVNQKEGEKYILDLQEDLENIQSHSFTKKVGISPNTGMPVIKRFDMEQIDKKLGYISNDFYYSDDYLYLIKSDIGLFETLEQKAKFVLENLDIYYNKDMKYAERTWHHEKLLQELFSSNELNKIHQIHCYRETENGKKYQNCIAVQVSKGTDIYLFSEDDNKYVKVTNEEFIKEKENGLVNIEGIPGLKKSIKERSL